MHSTNVLRIVFMALFMFVALPVQAILVTTAFYGEIYTADAGNAFGVSVGDIIDGYTTYDDSLVAAIGASSVNISSNPDFSLYLTIGSYTFNHTMDVEYPYAFPTVDFFDGQIASFNFVTLSGINGSLYDMTLFNSKEFSAGIYHPADVDQFVVTGEITRFGPAVAVPEPSVISLFVVGLVGLGFARSRT